MNPKTSAAAGMRQRHDSGAGLGSLNLIHRNNSPKPISMRVTARFDFPPGLDLVTVKKAFDLAIGPLGHMMMKRGSDGT